MKSSSTTQPSDGSNQKLLSREEEFILARFARRALNATRYTLSKCTFVIL